LEFKIRSEKDKLNLKCDTTITGDMQFASLTKTLPFFILINLMPLQAQDVTVTIKKLNTELLQNPDTKRRAVIYSDLTWYYSKYITDSAIVYGNKAKDLAIALNDSSLLAQVYSDIGSIYLSTGNLEPAKLNYTTCYKIREKLGDSLGLAKCNINIASIYQKENKLKLASEIYLNCLKIFKERNLQKYVSTILSNLAQVLIKTGNTQKALQYAKEAVAFQKKNNETIPLTMSYVSLGNVYIALRDTPNAIKSYRSSVELAKSTGNNQAASAALNNLSLIAASQQQSNKLDSLVTQSDSLSKKIGLNGSENVAVIAKGKNLLRKEKFLEAKICFFNALKSYSLNVYNPRALLDAYSGLIEANGYMGYGDSVSYYLNKSLVLQNEVIANDVGTQINDLEVKYETKEKETTIFLQNEKITQRNNLIIFIVVSTFLLVVISILLFSRYKTKKNKQLIEQENTAAIKILQSEQTERMRIARELHDGIGQKLTVLKMYSSDENTQQKDLLEETINEVRSISHKMMPEIINLGLVPAVKDLCAKINDGGTIKCVFECDQSQYLKFATDIELSIYRIVQEVLNNMIKHAQANQIKVSFSLKGMILRIHIKDDGVGFDTKKIHTSSGIGWSNIITRAKIISANLDVSSTDKGTSVVLNMHV
jgi:signal transduction histidine kinase